MSRWTHPGRRTTRKSYSGYYVQQHACRRKSPSTLPQVLRALFYTPRPGMGNARATAYTANQWQTNPFHSTSER